MGDNLRVFQYSFQSKMKMVERKKRESNPFILYRNDLRKKTPKNIKMTKLSKIASDAWKTMPENQKVYWRRLYEINRDLPDTTDAKNLETQTDKVSKITSNP